MSDGTRKVRMVWRDPARQEAATGVDLAALEFKMNPPPRAGDYVCLTLASKWVLSLVVVGVSHHVTPVTEGHDTIHHVDLWMEPM